MSNSLMVHYMCIMVENSARNYFSSLHDWMQKMMDLSIYVNRILGIMGLCRGFGIILGSCLRGCILWGWLLRVGEGWGWGQCCWSQVGCNCCCWSNYCSKNLVRKFAFTLSLRYLSQLSSALASITQHDYSNGQTYFHPASPFAAVTDNEQ